MKFGISDFFQDVGNFLKSGTVLGVDMGTVSIKIIELSERRNKFKLENYGILETKKYLDHPNQVIQTSSLKFVEDEVYNLTKILLKEMRPKTKLAIASVPTFNAFITFLDMPLFSKDETAKTIAFQAKQYIPLPASSVSVDWFKIEEYEDERGQKNQRVLLIGFPVEIIRKYKTIFGKLGLKLIALEIEGLALTRAFFDKNDDSITMIVDIGAESTNMLVVEKGVMKYSGQTDYGGIFLTGALGRSLGISVSRAEELKKRRGLLASGGEYELSTLILPFLDVIIQEVKHAQGAFERRYGKKIQKLLLTGGGAKLLGIEEYFSTQIDLRITNSFMLTGIEHREELEPVSRNLNCELPVAIGLAKRYFS